MVQARCELHGIYIGQIERGQRTISLHNIIRVAEALQLDPGHLVKGLRLPNAT
ncbi:helix-turn-helix domain-containing protein [Nocardioides acrostichi]|uniref:Helix-turn-helix transcriptional regulator n=1 Tax=Nocardioides acrostichi TaxID=2784339 RepID=A0A930V4U5_9ACTN|nr:helix-turn-helix transcriptional regulator [Nocardioides acrostichi]